MLAKRLVLLLVAAITLFLILLPTEFGAQFPQSPQILRHMMQLRDFAGPPETSPSRVPLGPPPERIATLNARIDRDRQDVHVYQDGRPVKLLPGFHQLIVATPADHQKELENVAGKSVALVPSVKHKGRSDIFVGVGGVREFCLAGNIFVVKQVLLSSKENPVEVQVDGGTLRLKPGEALLLM